MVYCWLQHSLLEACLFTAVEIPCNAPGTAPRVLL